jgi:phage terminase Nu1 subunit (DNA packaging protein)
MNEQNEQFIFIAPLHLKRKEDIADIFGVNPETVKEWAKDGAPIVLVGNKYQADYHALFHWLTKNRPAFKNLSTTPLPPL